MNPDASPRPSGRENEPVSIGAEVREIEDQLRTALRHDAGSIQPHERLGSILSTANSAPLGGAGTRRRWLVLAAAAGVAVVAGGTVWLAGRPTALAPVPAGSTTSRVTSVATSPVPTASSGTDPATLPSASTTPSTTPAATSAPVAPSGSIDGVPVYWIGQTAGSPRLFREFRTVPDEGGPIRSALYAMTRQTPLDPDYSTPWRPASRIDVERNGDNLVVDLSADAGSSTGVGTQLAEQAVQQLVYTATAAASTASTPVTTVTILVDGAPADLWGAVHVGAPMSRAPMAEVQSHVWITSPVEGQRLARGPVEVTAYGTSFEATFRWELTSAAGNVTMGGGIAQGGSNGQFEEFRFTIGDLAAGSYVLSLSTDDPSGGASGAGPQVDTKSFTIP